MSFIPKIENLRHFFFHKLVKKISFNSKQYLDNQEYYVNKSFLYSSSKIGKKSDNNVAVTLYERTIEKVKYNLFKAIQN
ncbi:hypothetical protein BpHYR1_042630 [Brachionus plicatilis]|uniref:Uncharacterized protein n=1 Tax=Brachionus plicatilis TaxID=10195 RepID=A0A3M7T820_BRAPC|nr:hypothetical protein BpHYR1_042630 [Brachionus plicatilis]